MPRHLLIPGLGSTLSLPQLPSLASWEVVFHDASILESPTDQDEPLQEHSKKFANFLFSLPRLSLDGSGADNRPGLGLLQSSHLTLPGLNDSPSVVSPDETMTIEMTPQR